MQHTTRVGPIICILFIIPTLSNCLPNVKKMFTYLELKGLDEVNGGKSIVRIRIFLNKQGEVKITKANSFYRPTIKRDGSLLSNGWYDE